MNIRLQKELEKIRKMLLSLGAMVEDRFQKAVRALENANTEICNEIILTDLEVNEAEVELEEECLKIIALHQPVAADLRLIVVVIKINNDLERIADQAVNIAERVKNIYERGCGDFIYDFSKMAETAGKMLKSSLDAFVNQDPSLARAVCHMDHEVDIMNQNVYDLVKEEIMKNPSETGCFINLLLISRHLERIGDHATNIAEEVIYMLEGEIVRHRF